MIVSTKGRYALRVMIDLSEHQSEKYVPLKEIAARQEISDNYLENILKVLVQNGFLEGLTPNATPCSRMANCRTYEMWKGLDDLISNYFGNITLADLARPDQAGNDYVI